MVATHRILRTRVQIQHLVSWGLKERTRACMRVCVLRVTGGK